MLLYTLFFFFKQKTAYEMRISDWSSDVCSSDLNGRLEFADAEDVDVDLQLVERILEIEVGASRSGEEDGTQRRQPHLVGEGCQIIAVVEIGGGKRSEERRVGNELVGRCSSRRSTYH